jgi:hypothetical protein
MLELVSVAIVWALIVFALHIDTVLAALGGATLGAQYMIGASRR